MARGKKREGWMTPREFASLGSCSVQRDATREKARAKVHEELLETATTITDHLATEPGSLKALMLADLLAALLDADAPEALRDGAARVPKVPPEAEERATFFALGAGLWRRLASDDVLDVDAATIIASRIAPCGDEPALLFMLQREAEEKQLTDAAAAFTRELSARFPAFARRRDRLPITRELLAFIGVDDSVRGLGLSFHGDGHLACLSAPGRGGPTLTLDRVPGAGHFKHEGSRGGSGFIVDERYEQGAVHTEVFSPWHDGTEYATKTDWVVWVLQCATTVAQEARRQANQR